MRVRDWIVVGLLMNGLPIAMFLHWLSWDIRHEEKMDNEEDCGHVIRVGNPGGYRNADHVRSDFR